MRRAFKSSSVLALAALAVVAGCESIRLDRGDVLGNAATGYVRDPEVIVATTDWSATESVGLVCKDYRVRPESFAFEQGRAYRLRLSNPDEGLYYVVGEAFYKSIAVQKLVSAAGEETFPYYEAIALEPGQGKDLYFVPVQDGSFTVECSGLWNMVLGNTARIAVAPTPEFEATLASEAAMSAASVSDAAAAGPIDPSLRARELVMNDIRTADRQELEAIKADLARMQELIARRAAELGAAGE